MSILSPLLQTRALSIGYRTGKKGVRALASSLELSMYPGQLICLLGPNGSGKSTLIRTLAGLQKGLSGQVEIKGKNIDIMKPFEMATKLSMVLTEKVQAGNLDAYTVIGLGRYPYTDWKGTLTKADSLIIEQAIIMTRTEPFIDRKIHQLSDGERQRVMLARALAQDTPVVILDEPTAYLDLPNRISLMRLLHQLTRTTNKAILLSTHDLDLALQTADQLWLLKINGQLLKGLPEDLVLNGTFEEAFLTDGFTFDKNSGTFVIHHEGSRTIRVTGQGTSLVWTKRALVREGYGVTENEAAERIEIIEEKGAIRWIYRSGQDETVCDSIAGVSALLRVKQGTEFNNQP